MDWVLAVKLGLQSLFNEDTRKKTLMIIAGILLLITMMVFLVSVPALLLNLPFTAYQSKTQSDNANKVYIDMMVEYKIKINDEVMDMKADNIDIEKTNVNYPSLSLMIAYDNVINKDRYKNNTLKIKVDKAIMFKFLDSCMSYAIKENTIVAVVKSVENIAKINFKSIEDRNMFISIYNTLRKTDLDNSVPDVKLDDLQYLEGGIKLPYINQTDTRWKNAPYGSSTIGKSGCGIVSMSMIINGLVPNISLSPIELAAWSSNNGYYIPGQGTAWSIFPALAKKYNLNVKILSRNNPQSILNELGKGNPIVVSMSAGHFTKGGHFIVLRGIKEGKILVNDPASIKRSKQSWDYSIILTESSTNSANCFWVFSIK